MRYVCSDFSVTVIFSIFGSAAVDGEIIRKPRKQKAAFRDKSVNPDEAQELMLLTAREIRRLRAEGKDVKSTSRRRHGCNRCRVCTGACPT